MSDHAYAAHMAEVKRERETETEVRFLDADDIVRWIHRLEDEISEHEQEKAELVGALRAVCDCIMETRGPNAHREVANARAMIAAYDKRQEQGDE